MIKEPIVLTINFHPFSNFFFLKIIVYLLQPTLATHFYKIYYYFVIIKHSINSLNQLRFFEIKHKFCCYFILNFMQITIFISAIIQIFFSWHYHEVNSLVQSKLFMEFSLSQFFSYYSFFLSCNLSYHFKKLCLMYDYYYFFLFYQALP